MSVRTGPDATPREPSAQRQRFIEAALLALLAVLPLVPYLAFLLREGVPRYGLFGDFALLEHATRHVWHGDTLLGPYSRFRWNHPGPLFFYIAAPFELLFGKASTGLYLATWMVNAGATTTLVVTARLFGGRSHAAACLIGLLAWLMAFGNIAINPWNPLVVVLPLMAFLATTSMFARGKSGAIYPASLFGALVLQHHVAAVSTVVVVGVLALVAFLVGARRRGGLEQNERRRLAIGAGLLFVLFLPPLVEQVTAPSRGNLVKLLAFFVDREVPLRPLGVAAREWMTAASWMPDRIVHRAIAEEGFIPIGMRWDPMPRDVSTFARTFAALQVGATLLAAGIAARRRDPASIALLGFAVVANVMAITALKAVIGESFHYLVFWTTAASSVAWMGILSAFFAPAHDAITQRPRLMRPVAIALAILGIGAAATASATQQAWIAKHRAAPASRPEVRDDLRLLSIALERRLAQDGSTAVLHMEGSWDMTDAMVLELEKDHVDVRLSEKDRWNFYGVRSDVGVARPLHVYFDSIPLPLALAPCLTLLEKRGEYTMYVAPSAVAVCPTP